MSGIQIKFCGLTRLRDVEVALTLDADYLGFVVECKSKRRLSLKEAVVLANPVRGLAKRVIITVNPDLAFIEKLDSRIRPEFIQLHGDESADYTTRIRAHTRAGVIKALSIGTRSDMANIYEYEKAADMLLLDAKPPGEGPRGGYGKPFDWSMVTDFKSKVPLILAGGLTPENIREAKKTGVSVFDVSSGVEFTPGVKDAALMTRFAKAARE